MIKKTMNKRITLHQLYKKVQVYLRIPHMLQTKTFSVVLHNSVKRYLSFSAGLQQKRMHLNPYVCICLNGCS